MSRSDSHRPAATVYLVGAGPGDPGLLTLRGRERLERADLVLYDYLVDPRVLVHARPGAELVSLGRHGQGRILEQEEVHRLMIEAASSGRIVVRLKGGDAALFGRLAEEIAALEQAGLAYEVVPGVTAASAASATTGIPLTSRDAASCVAFVTGQECRSKAGESLDLAALARFPGTLVFYMGVTAAPEWSAELIRHGMSPDTPAAIVRRASWPDQRTILTTLSQLKVELAPGRVRPPAVIVVGQAVAQRSAHRWFDERPLFGRTVLVTRPRGQADDTARRFEELGARVLRQPAIEIRPVADPAALDDAIARAAEFDWIVFSSVNGVAAFLDRLDERGLDARRLGGARLAAIGPATAEALAACRLRADLVPDEFQAEALAEALLLRGAGCRALLVRASRGREVLAESLAAAGVAVEQVVAYESVDVAAADPAVASALAAEQIDWTLVTSSAIARSLAALFGDDLRRTRLAAISPLTAGALRELGFACAAVAAEATTPSLVEAVLQADGGTSPPLSAAAR